MSESIYGFRASGLVDIGKKRSSNQDEIILLPECGFFAVSDGMGGLQRGGDTSAMIKKVFPDMIRNAADELKHDPSPARAAELLDEQVRMLSDSIYDTGNKDGYVAFGATLSGVWLVGNYAVYVNLGDSRGYLLSRYQKNICQITKDHNVAALLVEQGELTREQAREHPTSSQLRRFVGMPAPAEPETFITEVRPGDRILLCSDGLHGMVADSRFPRIMRSTKSAELVCRRMIDEANENGGRDNISAVYVKIFRKRS